MVLYLYFVSLLVLHLYCLCHYRCSFVSLECMCVCWSFIWMCFKSSNHHIRVPFFEMVLFVRKDVWRCYVWFSWTKSKNFFSILAFTHIRKHIDWQTLQVNVHVLIFCFYWNCAFLQCKSAREMLLLTRRANLEIFTNSHTRIYEYICRSIYLYNIEI